MMSSTAGKDSSVLSQPGLEDTETDTQVVGIYHTAGSVMLYWLHIEHVRYNAIL